MFTRIQALRYRGLKFVDQRMDRFQALVGPNASGKSTFLDTLGLLSDVMRLRGDVPEAIRKQSPDFSRLVWRGEGTSFQIAVEAEIPAGIRRRSQKQKHRFVRYEVEFSFDQALNEIGLDHEVLWLFDDSPRESEGVQLPLFPAEKMAPRDIAWDTGPGRRIVIRKKRGGNDEFKNNAMGGPGSSFKLGRTRSALANIPADDAKFWISLWFRDLLETGIQKFILDSQMIRQSSPPGAGRRFQTDGSNLPWVIHNLHERDPGRFRLWLDHVATALEDIRDIITIEREEDRHRYLVVVYSNGVRVPSWLVSDGTLRLLALTIPAYLDVEGAVFLIEEPENGIHPKAIETALQSLSSIYSGQVLAATHSTVVLNHLEERQLLCFAKDREGATDIVSGDKHPRLQGWKRGDVDLGTLFAAGILD